MVRETPYNASQGATPIASPLTSCDVGPDDGQQSSTVEETTPTITSSTQAAPPTIPTSPTSARPSKPDLFTTLPTELIIEILTHVDAYTLHTSTRLVSSKLNQLILTTSSLKHMYSLLPPIWSRILYYLALTNKESFFDDLTWPIIQVSFSEWERMSWAFYHLIRQSKSPTIRSESFREQLPTGTGVKISPSTRVCINPLFHRRLATDTFKGKKDSINKEIYWNELSQAATSPPTDMVKIIYKQTSFFNGQHYVPTPMQRILISTRPRRYTEVDVFNGYPRREYTSTTPQQRPDRAITVGDIFGAVRRTLKYPLTPLQIMAARDGMVVSRDDVRAVRMDLPEEELERPLICADGREAKCQEDVLGNTFLSLHVRKVEEGAVYLRALFRDPPRGTVGVGG